MRLADIAEVYHREHGIPAAVEAVFKRRGSSLDPTLVDEFRRLAPEVLPTMGPDSSWDEVIAAEPVVRAPLTESELDIALEAIADFTDLKSIYFSGHSRGVAKLAADAARHAGFPERDVVVLRRAGLVHDLGRSGVPNTIWDKPGPLTFLEWERVRLHPTTPNGYLHGCPPWPASPRSPSLTMSDSTGPATTVACPVERLDPVRGCSPRPTRTRR
jgi:HD-GYP domain-containing protein (c-di-GMP phosphodiesterase class II)